MSDSDKQFPTQQEGGTGKKTTHGGRRFAAPLALLGCGALAIGAAGFFLAGPAAAWTVQASASADCDGTNAVVHGTFENDEPNSDGDMNVTASYNGTSQGPTSVAHQSAATFDFPTGQQKVDAGTVTFTLTWASGQSGTDSQTASFTAVDCSPQNTIVTPKPPTHTTPDCTSQDEIVTPDDQPGVVSNPSGPTTLAPGDKVTYTYTPAPTYEFPAGDYTYTFKNNLDVSKCQTTPPSSPPPSTTPPTHGKGNVNATGICGTGSTTVFTKLDVSGSASGLAKNHKYDLTITDGGNTNGGLNGLTSDGQGNLSIHGTATNGEGNPFAAGTKYQWLLIDHATGDTVAKGTLTVKAGCGTSTNPPSTSRPVPPPTSASPRTSNPGTNIVNPPRENGVSGPTGGTVHYTWQLMTMIFGALLLAIAVMLRFMSGRPRVAPRHAGS